MPRISSPISIHAMLIIIRVYYIIGNKIPLREDNVKNKLEIYIY